MLDSQKSMKTCNEKCGTIQPQSVKVLLALDEKSANISSLIPDLLYFPQAANP